MWIKITAPFQWQPNARQIYVYRVGNSYSVTHVCGKLAIESGCAVKIPAPTKSEREQWATK